MGRTHRVVSIGEEFGGLRVAQALKMAPVDVTRIDRRNFHLFQPLLCQVPNARCREMRLRPDSGSIARLSDAGDVDTFRALFAFTELTTTEWRDRVEQALRRTRRGAYFQERSV
jgi:hypothetical protein